MVLNSYQKRLNLVTTFIWTARITVRINICKSWIHTEKYFQNFIKLNRNQIVFTISDHFKTKRTSVWFQINRIMVNTIWFRLDFIRFLKDFSVCGRKDSHDWILFSLWLQVLAWLGKHNTDQTCIDLQETVVSRHHVGTIKCLP